MGLSQEGLFLQISIWGVSNPKATTLPPPLPQRKSLLEARARQDCGLRTECPGPQAPRLAGWLLQPATAGRGRRLLPILARLFLTELLAPELPLSLLPT